jgi:hypothetical protein
MISEIQAMDFHQLSPAAQGCKAQNRHEVRTNSRIETNGSNNREDRGFRVGRYSSSAETSPRSAVADKTLFRQYGYPVLTEAFMNGK